MGHYVFCLQIKGLMCNQVADQIMLIPSRVLVQVVGQRSGIGLCKLAVCMHGMKSEWGSSAS